MLPWELLLERAFEVLLLLGQQQAGTSCFARCGAGWNSASAPRPRAKLVERARRRAPLDQLPPVGAAIGRGADEGGTTWWALVVNEQQDACEKLEELSTGRKAGGAAGGATRRNARNPCEEFKAAGAEKV